MEVHLTDDQKAFIREGMETGRFSREEDAVREALSLWEGRERRRAEILAAVDIAGLFGRPKTRMIALLACNDRPGWDTFLHMATFEWSCTVLFSSPSDKNA
jgi:Arc/MetJ-type ribon-helix-helix transcriptional regulator